jgi:hypothetical protein
MNNQSDDQDKSDNNSISVTNYAEEIYGISFFKKGKGDSDITISPFYPGLEPTEPIIKELDRDLNQLNSSDRLDFLNREQESWTTHQDNLRRKTQSWEDKKGEWISKWQEEIRAMSPSESNESLTNQLEKEFKRIVDNHFGDLPNSFTIDEVLRYLGIRISALEQIVKPTTMKTLKKKPGTKTDKIIIGKTLRDFIYALIRLIELGYISIDTGLETFVLDHFKKSKSEINGSSIKQYNHTIYTDPDTCREDGETILARIKSAKVSDRTDDKGSSKHTVITNLILSRLDRRKHKRFLQYCEENEWSLQKGLEFLIDLALTTQSIYTVEGVDDDQMIRNLGKACLDTLKFNLKENRSRD